MNILRVRVNFDGFRRKAEKLKTALAEESERELMMLAEQAVEMIEAAPPDDRRKYVAGELAKQFASVFVPVTLKHKRPERWPNLREIYEARIVRGQKTYDGRKVLYVDEHKEGVLFDELLRRAVARGNADQYEVRLVTTYEHRCRVEIVRVGTGGVPSVVVAFARQRVKISAENVLSRAVSRAGFR